jgi:predicted O-linked N-acetylglucosamine transferase (SPINDLY family)
MLNQTGDSMGAADVLNRLCRKAATAGNAKLLETAVRDLAALDAIHPSTTETANMLRVAGRADLATVLLDRVLKASPGDLGAGLVRAIASLPVIYDSEAEIDRDRSRYAALLADLDAASEAAPAGDCAAAFEQVGKAKPFYLSYQGHDDRTLQARYGRVAARFARAAIAEPEVAPRKGRGRIRVGFASHYFFFHSVSKLFRGWIEKLDRDRFEVVVYDLNGGTPDAWATAIGEAAAHVRRGNADAAAWAKQIAADKLDVLIYPEIGMETLAVRLACLRLAPVQCVAWGHPVTSGLPEIDFFLSSELMEPADGAAHYTERLVRLPNLSVCYAPVGGDGPPRDRASLGLDAGDVVFVSCQSLFKYLPRFDAVFPAIAARVPNARFLFLANLERDGMRLIRIGGFPRVA